MGRWNDKRQSKCSREKMILYTGQAGLSSLSMSTGKHSLYCRGNKHVQVETSAYTKADGFVFVRLFLHRLHF